MKILSDIGGTYARFAVEEGGRPGAIVKYRAADYATFEDALAAFCAERGIKGGGELLIATAAYEDGKVWRFVNRNIWVLDPDAMVKAGWKPVVMLNDFAAATWGLKNIGKDDVEILKAGVQGDLPKVLLGPGTGLGLGYLYPGHVQRTHGGHMVAAAITEEQNAVIGQLQKEKKIVVYEHLVSGPGLQNIHAALCAIAGKKNNFERAEDILTHAEDKIVKEALRLFHEFFGLFAQNAVLCGHAYGGLYLTGGMTDRLIERGLFDFQLFEKFFVLPVADQVTRDMDATPVYHVTHPALAMKGLLEAEKHG